MTRSVARSMLGFTIVLGSGILAFLLFAQRDPSRPSRFEAHMFTDQQIASLRSQKVFFGHQSVGNNIINGIRDLAGQDARLNFNIVKSADPQSVPGPAFVEFNIGDNGNPQSKIDAFTAVLDKGMGAQGGIAMFKLCFVDIDFATDIPKLAAAYRDAIAALKKKYPLLEIVHVTVPLTAPEPLAKAWVKTLLGRATRLDLNAKREEFNELLRRAYTGTDPIFDLAQVESTHIGGSRSYFMQGNQRIYTLAAEFTADGGHLNEVGRRRAAEQLLVLLASMDPTSSSVRRFDSSQPASQLR